MAQEMRAWTEQVQSQFEILITINDEKKQFVSWKVHIKDPDHEGQSFDIYFNEESQASLLEMDGVHLGRFNIAEGYTSQDILDAALAILDGQFVIKNPVLRRAQACFQTSRGTVCGKITNHAFKAVRGYKRKAQKDDAVR